MSPVAHPALKQFAGFSLVEVMIAMVIGMFGIIVMMQVFALSEERKRTTTGGSDAMTEGVMALYGLQRDVRMGGYGIGDVNVLGCNVLLRAGVTLNAMAPVTVNHASITGQDANTDTLLVVYGNSNTSPQGDSITTAGTTTYGVQTPSSFVAADRVVAAPQVRAAPCNLTLDSIAAAGVNVTVTTGVAMNIGDTLFNLGQAPKAVAYAIRGGNLTACDYMVNDCGNAINNASAAIWVPIANNIVGLRAQYGRDTAAGTMDGFVDVYDQATPNPVLTPNTACGWARISALRLALVARSAQFEKTAVTQAAPEWEGTSAGNPPGSAASPIDVSGDASWQNYRYKVFQTVVPIRNIAWLGVATGC